MDLEADPIRRGASSSLTRRRVLKLAGAAAGGMALARSPRPAAADGHDQHDFAGFLGASIQFLPPDYTQSPGRFILAEETRRLSPVMNVDPLTGIEGAWNGGGDTSFILPAPDSPLGYSRIIYLNVDNFTGHDNIATFLDTVQAALTPYGPTPVPLPDGLAANAFASRVAFPFASDQSVTIDRVIFGCRKRDDALLFTFDGYDNPFTDERVVELVTGLSNTFSDFWNTSPLLGDLPIYGVPNVISFGWNAFDSTIARQYGDDEAALERRTALHGGSTWAYSDSYSAYLESLAADTAVLNDGWLFPDAEAAAGFRGELFDRLGPSDEANGVIRHALPDVFDLGDGRELSGDRFNFPVGQTEVFHGISLTTHADNRVFSTIFLNLQPISDGPAPDDGAWRWSTQPGATSEEEIEILFGVVQDGGWGILDSPNNPYPLSFGHGVPLE